MRNTKSLSDTPFGERLRKAFGGATDSDIARKLRKTPSDVGKWTKRTELPRAPILIEITRITKCDLHWLLTGEGEESVDSLRFLSLPQREVVELLARQRKVSVDEILQEVVSGGLAARAIDLFSRYRRLRPSEVDELQLLFELVRREGRDHKVDERIPRAG